MHAQALPLAGAAEAAGGAVTLEAVCHCATQGGDGKAAELRALLRRGAPPVPADAPITACPMYALSRAFELRLEWVGGFALWGGAAWSVAFPAVRSQPACPHSTNTSLQRSGCPPAACRPPAPQDAERLRDSDYEDGAQRLWLEWLDETRGSYYETPEEEREYYGAGGRGGISFHEYQWQQQAKVEAEARQEAHQEFLERMDALAEAGALPAGWACLLAGLPAQEPR